MKLGLCSPRLEQFKFNALKCQHGVTDSSNSVWICITRVVSAATLNVEGRVNGFVLVRTISPEGERATQAGKVSGS